VRFGERLERRGERLTDRLVRLRERLLRFRERDRLAEESELLSERDREDRFPIASRNHSNLFLLPPHRRADGGKCLMS